LSENLPPPPESLPLGDIEMPEGVYNAANRTGWHLVRRWQSNAIRHARQQRGAVVQGGRSAAWDRDQHHGVAGVARRL
jgi:hypothetical protein